MRFHAKSSPLAALNWVGSHGASIPVANLAIELVLSLTLTFGCELIGLVDSSFACNGHAVFAHLTFIRFVEPRQAPTVMHLQVCELWRSQSSKSHSRDTEQ
jgi:hypothetical protein